jgi:hypothetical protein
MSVFYYKSSVLNFLKGLKIQEHPLQSGVNSESGKIPERFQISLENAMQLMKWKETSCLKITHSLIEIFRSFDDLNFC